MMLVNSGVVHCVLYEAEDVQVVQELDTGSCFGEISCLPAVLRGLIDAGVSVAGIYLYPSIYPSIYPSTCVSTYRSMYISIYRIYRSTYRSIDPSIYLPIYRSIYLSVYLCSGARRTRCVFVSGMTRGGVAKTPLLL